MLAFAQVIEEAPVLSECPKAQEPLLIFLHSSICRSTCSFNQHWLWVPAPDAKLSATWGPKVRVDPRGKRPMVSGRRKSYFLSQSVMLLDHFSVKNLEKL